MGVAGSLGYAIKKVNSTSQDYTSVESFSNALLKEPCDLHNPVLQLEGSYALYTYMEISTFNAFYWVDRVVSFPNGIIEVHAHLDPLATYRDEIFAGHAYATYGAFADWNKAIDDPRLTPDIYEYSNSQSYNVFNFTMPTDFANGSVILCVFQCPAGGADTGVSFYAMDVAEFQTCLTVLNTVLSNHVETQVVIQNDMVNRFNSIKGLNITSDDQAVANLASQAVWSNAFEKFLGAIGNDLAGLGSWRDNIISCKYVPIPKAHIPGESKPMYLGTIPCGNHRRVKPADVETHTQSVSIPWGSNVSGYPFLRLPKYSQLQVICMGGYYQTIDGSCLMKDDDTVESDICIHSSIDLVNGDWAVSINKGSNVDAPKLGTFSGNCSIDITGLLGKGGSGWAMQTANNFGKAAAGFWTGGIVTNYLNAGEGYSASNNPGNGIIENFSGSSITGMGSGACGGGLSSMYLSGTPGKVDIAGILFKPKIIEDSIYADYCNEYGWVVNNYVSIGAQMGVFLKCSGASIICSGNQQDQSYINSTLNSGIWIEE